jgi:hypothetical protein
VLVAHGIYFCQTKHVFDIAVGESRYERVGEFAARELPDRSVLLSMQHSGSLRYYSQLPTLRYDLIDPDRLDDVVAHFQARGWDVFIVVDEWEEREFRGRFARTSALGRLDWAPFAEAPGRMPGAMPVAIYDPRDRMSTRSVALRIIP